MTVTAVCPVHDRATPQPPSRGPAAAGPGLTSILPCVCNQAVACERCVDLPADRLVDGAALCEECAAAEPAEPPDPQPETIPCSTGPKGTVA